MVIIFLRCSSLSRLKVKYNSWSFFELFPVSPGTMCVEIQNDPFSTPGLILFVRIIKKIK